MKGLNLGLCFFLGFFCFFKFQNCELPNLKCFKHRFLTTKTWYLSLIWEQASEFFEYKLLLDFLLLFLHLGIPSEIFKCLLSSQLIPSIGCIRYFLAKSFKFDENKLILRHHIQSFYMQQRRSRFNEASKLTCAVPQPHRSLL